MKAVLWPPRRNAAFSGHIPSLVRVVNNLEDFSDDVLVSLRLANQKGLVVWRLPNQNELHSGWIVLIEDLRRDFSLRFGFSIVRNSYPGHVNSMFSHDTKDHPLVVFPFVLQIFISYNIPQVVRF